MNQQLTPGTCQMIWFLNPGNQISGEVGLGSQFFPDRESALEYADLYGGDWVIMELMIQNPEPDSTYFWKLLEYGAWKKFKNNSFGRL